jgi:hypothetical protein
MFLRLRTVVVGLVIVAAATLPHAANAGEAVLSADLDGRPIPLQKVSDFYCHDFDWPAIHCYTAPVALEQAVARVALERSPGATSTTEAVSALNYIRVFDLTWYAGTYIYLSQNYSHLSVIGWNDRISSYTGSNFLTSALFVDVWYEGSGFIVCCNNKASTLSSTFDNKISSAERL